MFVLFVTRLVLFVNYVCLHVLYAGHIQIERVTNRKAGWHIRHV